MQDKVADKESELYKSIWYTFNSAHVDSFLANRVVAVLAHVSEVFHLLDTERNEATAGPASKTKAGSACQVLSLGLLGLDLSGSALLTHRAVNFTRSLPVLEVIKIRQILFRLDKLGALSHHHWLHLHLHWHRWSHLLLHWSLLGHAVGSVLIVVGLFIVHDFLVKINIIIYIFIEMDRGKKATPDKSGGSSRQKRRTLNIEVSLNKKSSDKSVKMQKSPKSNITRNDLGRRRSSRSRS